MEYQSEEYQNIADREKFMQCHQTAVMPDGLWPVMLTPFTEEKEVDYQGLKALTRWYLEQGAAGLFAVCLSNEMELLTEEERLKISSCVKEEAGDVPVASTAYVEVPKEREPEAGDCPEASSGVGTAAGTDKGEIGAASEDLASGADHDTEKAEKLQELIDSVRKVASTGVDVVVLLTNSLAGRSESEEQVKAAIGRILEAAPEVRFGLYECPKPYKRLFSPALVKWCAGTGRFVFYKETSLDPDILRGKLEAVKGTPLKIYNADSSLMFDFLKMGGHGHCGVMLSFHPEIYGWMMKNWREDGQTAEHVKQLMTITAQIERQCYPRSAKYALGRRGVPIGDACRRENAAGWDASCVRAVEDMEKFTEAWFAELQRKRDCGRG